MIPRERLIPDAGRDDTESTEGAARPLRLEKEANEPEAEGPLTTTGPIRRFVVRADDRAYIVKAAEVDWFEAARNYVLLHVGQNEYRLRVTLQSLLDGLDPAVFQRIHKSSIVNLDRIREIQPWFGGDYIAVLENGKQLRVSRSYARALLRPVQ